MARDHHSFVLW